MPIIRPQAIEESDDPNSIRPEIVSGESVGINPIRKSDAFKHLKPTTNLAIGSSPKAKLAERQ